MDGLGEPRSPEESRFRAETAERMRYPAAAPEEVNLEGDPTWQKIRSSFDDILGGMARMDVEMPIALPDTQDPQDVLRYLGELEKAGIDSRASASYLGAQQRGGMQFGDALNMMKFIYQQQKDNMQMLATIIPNIEDADLRSQMSTQLLNMMQPGHFGTVARSVFKFSGAEGTQAITEENIEETMEFRRIADSYAPQLESLYQAKDQKNYDLMMNSIYDMLLTQYKWPEDVVKKATDRIHAEVVTRSRAKELGSEIY
jgi:hypothetical protein